MSEALSFALAQMLSSKQFESVGASWWTMRQNRISQW